MALQPDNGDLMECAHEACTCLVMEKGEFCSESCEIGTMSGVFCGCDHPACQGSRLQAPAIDKS
jgi:hypothetical protein